MPAVEPIRRTRRGVLAALVGGLGGCAAVAPDTAAPPTAEDWPMQGATPAGDYHQAAVTGPDGGVRERWRRDLGTTVGSHAEPIVFDGTLYVRSTSLDVVDAGDGTRRRSVDVSLAGPPAVTTRTPYRNETLVGVTWPGSADSTVPGTDGGGRLPASGVVGLNPAGSLGSNPRLRLRWQHPGGSGRFSFWGDDHQLGAVPVGDRVLFGGAWTHTDGRRRGLFALDTATGDLDWAYTTSETVGRPSVRDGVAYIVSRSGHCHAVADGSRRWRRALDLDVLAVRPIVATAEVVVLASRRRVWGLDPASGETVWRRELPGQLSYPTQALTAADGLVLVPRRTEATTTLFALRTDTGETAWQSDVGRLLGQPTVADGTVYLVAGGMTLAALTLADGSVRWTFDLDGSVASTTPVVAAGRLYLQTHDHLYALEASA